MRGRGTQREWKAKPSARVPKARLRRRSGRSEERARPPVDVLDDKELAGIRAARLSWLRG
jgi:hypothetical protein